MDHTGLRKLNWPCSDRPARAWCSTPKKDATLWSSVEPIEEPIARYGPFVMNTREELCRRRKDYQAGKMGHLS